MKKRFFMLLFLLFSISAFAGSDIDSLKSRLDALEKRVSRLEGKSASNPFDAQDMKGGSIKSGPRVPSSSNQLSPEQQKKMREEMEKLKKMQDERMKYLEELDKEDL